MKTHSLKALSLVIETGTVTKAAERLFLTQPQVSKLISELEDELGFACFSRKGRGLVPTKEGLYFYTKAKRILMDLEEMPRIAEDIRLSRGRKMHIVAPSYMVGSSIPEAIKIFSNSHPDIRYSLGILARNELGRFIVTEQFDIGFAALPIDIAMINTFPFAAYQTVLVMPKGHKLTERKTIDASDLSDFPFIALRPFTLGRHLVDQCFSNLKIPLDIRYEVANCIMACELAAKGLGITLVDLLSTISFEADSVEVRLWDPGIASTYALFFNSTDEPSNLCLDFAKTAVKVIRKSKPEFVSPVDSDILEE